MRTREIGRLLRSEIYQVILSEAMKVKKTNRDLIFTEEVLRNIGESIAIKQLCSLLPGSKISADTLPVLLPFQSHVTIGSLLKKRSVNGILKLLL